jgi:hypothetical protein
VEMICYFFIEHDEVGIQGSNLRIWFHGVLVKRKCAFKGLVDVEKYMIADFNM